jgi:uncharacterized protein (TIGR02246 family)
MRSQFLKGTFMQDRKKLLAGIIALSFIMAGCAKKAGDTAADTMVSAPTGATSDHSADERAIIALDSGWMRNVMAKNVDSLMTYYASDAVSYGFGDAPARGTDGIRSLYTEMVKGTITNPTMNAGRVKFSDDGTMAFDDGTYSMTVTPPGGKPSNENGAYLNVWKRIDGQWKLMAEMSTPVPPGKM